jgi:hypothetical protein
MNDPGPMPLPCGQLETFGFGACEEKVANAETAAALIKASLHPLFLRERWLS